MDVLKISVLTLSDELHHGRCDARTSSSMQSSAENILFFMMLLRARSTWVYTPAHVAHRIQITTMLITPANGCGAVAVTVTHTDINWVDERRRERHDVKREVLAIRGDGLLHSTR